MILQPAIHDIQIGVGMGMLAARIRKQDQVNGDTVLVQPNEKGGAVRTAAIGNNIDMLTSFQSLFVSVFHLRRIQRFGRAALAGPLPSARQPRASPAGGTEADAALRVQNVGDNPMVAQDLRRPRRRAIEEAASVFCPVRAEAVDLQGQPIVQISAHRPPHDGDARQMAVRHAAQGKLMPSHRLMVAVVLCDKPVCVGKGHWFYSQHRLRLHQLYGGLPYQ